MNFLQKIGFGLKKTSDKISTGISDIFAKKKLDSQTLEELEELLISSDLGVQAASRIINEFSTQRIDREISDRQIRQLLADQIEKILQPCERKFSVTTAVKPFVILMIGVNGAGKTTTIGKLAAQFAQQKLQVSCIAADTFRAAAVDQLEVWAKRSHMRLFSGPDGCDSAGLCYDGLNSALKNHDDIVFIDTAGRLQNKSGLMEELKKMVRVIKKIMPDAPHAVWLTIDAAMGQNALAQIETFKQMIGVNGLIVTKLDGSAKGGVLVAAAQEHQLPIYYIGVGEKIEDLKEFNAAAYAHGLVDLSEKAE